MITHYPYKQLGTANHGWLKARHHFSFSRYYNAKRMGFGTLRVINDDSIKAGTSFPPHPHKNMEIITFVRSGAISHRGSCGNEGITSAGEVQVMSAGKGIVHEEYNRSKDPLTLYQIWIESNRQNVKPRWETKKFRNKTFTTKLPLLASGYASDSEEALYIQQKARIFGGKFSQGTTFTHSITHQAYILASSGSFEVSNVKSTISLNKGDGAEISHDKSITVTALTKQ